MKPRIAAIKIMVGSDIFLYFVNIIAVVTAIAIGMKSTTPSVLTKVRYLIRTAAPVKAPITDAVIPSTKALQMYGNN